MDDLIIEDLYYCNSSSDAELEKIVTVKSRRAPLSSEPRDLVLRRAVRRGKRRARRVANDQLLGGVLEKEGDAAEEEVEALSYSPLSLLFLDKESMQVWQEFSELSEEVQAELLSVRPKTNETVDHMQHDDFVIVDAEDIQLQDSRKLHPALSAEDGAARFSPYMRAVLKQRAPLGVVLYLEACVRSSLGGDSGAVHVHTGLSPFERLLLRAVAQYLSLECHSYDDEENNRVSEVENPWCDFSPPEMLLADFIELHWR